MGDYYYDAGEVYTVIVPREEGQDVIVRLGCDDEYDPTAWTLLGSFGDTDGLDMDITMADYCAAIELVQTIHRRLL